MRYVLSKRVNNKYGARKIKRDGYKFDSLAEADRYLELKIMEKAGQIQGLVVHPRYELCPRLELNNKVLAAIKYTADFEYIEDGKWIVEDVKGIMTRDASLRINLFQRLYPEVEFRILYAKRR